MGIGDIFKSNENKQLKEENERLKRMLSPEQNQIISAEYQLQQLHQQLTNISAQVQSAHNELNRVDSLVKEKQQRLIVLDDEILFQEFGLYKPTFNFSNSQKYKEKLDLIRQQQKAMIKGNTAVTGNMNWTVNGSTSQGKKMVSDMQKLLLRAFNGECDELVSKVKYNNYESYKKRITASCDAISKLGSMMNISISQSYYQLKLNELTLAFEYALKVQEEKEEQKAIKERMKEEAKLQKEIDDARKKLEKEQNHYENALNKVEQQLQTATGNQKVELERKKQEIEAQLQDNEKAMQDVDYRQANQRAGYVYIISNIGAFGEDVYKIGMTRRLDPQERIDELGSASVPFKFDVHAMIFSDDAPTLENALHHAFENQRINWVNNRKEFFRVSLDDIKKVIYQNFDKTVAFIDMPEAEQFRISERMKFEKLGYSACSNIKIPTVSVVQETPTLPQPPIVHTAPIQQSDISINSKNQYPQYSALVNTIKSHFGNEARLEYVEKPNAFNIIVSKNDLKLVRVRAYQRENNPFDITLYRADGTTLRMIFFSNQSELKGILSNNDELLLQGIH